MVNIMDSLKSTILVRHLPDELEEDEKRDFFFHFGAERVRLFGSKGPMKHCAFVEFVDTAAAEQAVQRLHQLEVLGCRLVAEFAKNSSKDFYPSAADGQKIETPIGMKKPSETLTQVTKPLHEQDESFKKFNIPYPRKANLHYLYPPPTVSTLTNIANALASHPRFYVQVLHLMNKMNIPAPFGSVTPTPPLPSEVAPLRRAAGIGGSGDVETATEPIEDVEMEYSSTEESEIGSDGEVKPTLSTAAPNIAQRRDKRPRKRMRLVQPDLSAMVKPTSIVKPSDIFEQPDHLRSSSIQFRISGQEIQEKGSYSVEQTLPVEGLVKQEDTEQVSGFGKIEPAPKPVLTEEMQKQDVDYKIDPKQFKSRSEIQGGCLTEKQMKDFSVFKNYQPGSVTSRLYIKNLAKQTTEQDLVNMFGSFVDWTDEYSFNAFDIRLMKEGRMKGQAFVTLPDEESAQNVVKKCNAYVLHNKPIVIQFARSAKPKESDDKK